MGRLWAFVVVALAACGRLGFDPVPTSSGDDGGNGDGGGDGSVTTGDAMPDALPPACASAMTLQPNMPIAISTCATGLDQFDGCAGNGTQEVVFRFTPPSTGSYMIRARDAGTQNVSNSTGVINATCTATTMCPGVYGNNFTGGQTYYFVVEASSGGCANIEFEAI